MIQLKDICVLSIKLFEGQGKVNFDKVNEAKMREGLGLRLGWSGGLGS